LRRRAFEMFHGKEQILRTGFSHDRRAALAGILEHIGFSAGVHVDDVNRGIGLGGHGGQAQGRFDRAPGRAGVSVPFRRSVPGGQGFGNQWFDDIAVFAVGHDQHAVFFGLTHGPEDGSVVEAQAVVIGGENLEGGDAHLDQGREFGGDGVVELGQVHVEGVVDGGFGGFLEPLVDAAG
jgi:hypothetical protein